MVVKYPLIDVYWKDFDCSTTVQLKSHYRIAQAHVGMILLESVWQLCLITVNTDNIMSLLHRASMQPDLVPLDSEDGFRTGCRNVSH